ncbi:MAG TPA: signal peptidase I [Solirubrobacteraceae bacterium]|nr:signal peptidase I [Solirubrobacteraceae bacterium]
MRLFGRLRANKLVELIVTVAFAAGLAFCVQAYAVKPYKIPSASMEPTLQKGDRVLVNRISHETGALPKVGQIVVFNPPVGAENIPIPSCGMPHSADSACPESVPERSSLVFIKRVVAVAGDRISIRGGHVLRNGVQEPDSYTAPCAGGQACDLHQTITVPKGQLFLMGDNRGNSDDSRFWGPIPTSWVIGEAFVLYWPLNRIGFP